MPLGRNQILKQIKAGDIEIEPFCESHLTPNGYDLSLSSEIYQMNNIDRPVNPLNEETLSDFLTKTKVTGEIELKPFEPISVLSREAIGLDSSLLARIEGRSSLGQIGVFPHMHSGVIDAGFGSQNPQRVIFTLMSCNPNSVIFHPGQSVAQLLFYPIEGPMEEETEYARYDTSPQPGFDEIISNLIEKPLCIGVTGLPAAGKSEVAQILASLLDAETHSLGGVVRKETKRREKDPTSENIRDVSVQLRDEGGDGAVAELLVEELDEDGSDCTRVIEGIRSKEEVNTLREQLSADLIMIAVHSPTETRLQRIGDRARSDDEASKEFLTNRDEKESRFGVREAITSSDYILTNNESMRDLERLVEHTVAKILSRQ
ncbi:hypothetical protein BRC86_12420 [Halobacteriales archaeon QS_3_64_16]|nr:MAG: hypothetical protein BRC86_12420 [Halobacteriales archaeon QS_3_64_16]